MDPDEDNQRDWPLVVITVVGGIGLIAFVVYALFVVLQMRI